MCVLLSTFTLVYVLYCPYVWSVPVYCDHRCSYSLHMNTEVWNEFFKGNAETHSNNMPVICTRSIILVSYFQYDVLKGKPEISTHLH